MFDIEKLLLEHLNTLKKEQLLENCQKNNITLCKYKTRKQIIRELYNNYDYYPSFGIRIKYFTIEDKILYIFTDDWYELCKTIGINRFKVYDYTLLDYAVEFIYRYNINAKFRGYDTFKPIKKLSDLKGSKDLNTALGNYILHYTKIFTDKYFSRRIIENNPKNLSIVHGSTEISASMILKNNKISSNDVSYFFNVKGIYFTLYKNEKSYKFFAKNSIYLFFSIEVLDKYDYYMNPNDQLGYIFEDTIMKGENPVETFIKNKWDRSYHEIVVLKDSISIKFLEKIVFTKKHLYDKFMNSDIKFKDKMFYKKL